MARTIGEEADVYEQRRSEWDDDIWIKGFKEGEAKVRPWPIPTGQWISYREHYDRALKRFVPCSEEPECLACNSQYESVKDRPRKWIMPALDKDGRLQYFKLGAKAFRKFKAREQRDPDGTLSNRDWLVIRSGTSMNDTEYDVDPSDKYKVKFKDAEVQPISNAEMKSMLGQKYDEYEADMRGEDGEEDAEKWDEPPAKKAAAKTTAKKTAKIAPAKASTRSIGDGGDDTNGSAPDDSDELPDKPSEEQIESAPTTVIKQWLRGKEVEFGSSESRAALVKKAKEYVPF